MRLSSIATFGEYGSVFCNLRPKQLVTASTHRSQRSHVARNTTYHHHHGLPPAPTRRLARLGLCKASEKFEDSVAVTQAPAWLSPFMPLLSSPAYKYWVQGAVVVFLLGLVDAAYSGDWSRIGAISKETEEHLKQVVSAVAAIHVGCAATSGLLLSRRGEQPWLSAKALLSGPLALLEVYAEPFSKSL